RFSMVAYRDWDTLGPAPIRAWLWEEWRRQGYCTCPDLRPSHSARGSCCGEVRRTMTILKVWYSSKSKPANGLSAVSAGCRGPSTRPVRPPPLPLRITHARVRKASTAGIERGIPDDAANQLDRR